MYVPPAFRQDDLPTLHAMIAQVRLATLVTSGPEGLIATHLPLLLDPEDGPCGTLTGHFAKPNPHWRTAEAGGGSSLAIFQGPEAYISPSWYPSKQAEGKAVPTWNYVAIHAHGPLEVFHEADALLDVVSRLSNRFEAGRPDPWSVADAPESYMAAMLKGIVGFRLRIERLEGKWKLSQNRSEADRAGVVAGLRDETAAGADGIADLMAEGLK